MALLGVRGDVTVDRWARSREKMLLYARFGVAHAWLVDPLARTLEVLRLDGAGWRVAATFEGDAIVRAEPFDAIELELGALWVR